MLAIVVIIQLPPGGLRHQYGLPPG